MSDNRLSVTDGCSLCKCSVGGVLPLAGRFRLWGDVLSLAYRGARGLFVGGRMVFVAGIEGLWSVGGNGLVSVADDSVLRGVAVDTARLGAVSDAFVDSCIELFFRVLRARGCVVDDDVVRSALSGAAGELVCAVLPGEQSLTSLGVDAVAVGLARVGDIVCGAAISVEASNDMMGEALRIAEGARLIAAASGGLP